MQSREANDTSVQLRLPLGIDQVQRKCSFRGRIKHTLNSARSFRVSDDKLGRRIDHGQGIEFFDKYPCRVTDKLLLFAFFLLPVCRSKGRLSHFLCPAFPAFALLLRSRLVFSFYRATRSIVRHRSCSVYRRASYPYNHHASTPFSLSLFSLALLGEPILT